MEHKFIFLLLTFYAHFHNLTRLVRDHLYSKALNVVKSGNYLQHAHRHHHNQVDDKIEQ